MRALGPNSATVKTMNITILANLEGEDSEKYDPVAEALRQGRHKPSILAVYGDQRELVNCAAKNAWRSSPARPIGSKSRAFWSKLPRWHAAGSRST
jgi:hypothetical protein